MMNEELLLSLAQSYGFGTTYRASDGQLTTPPAQSFLKLLRAIGVDVPDSPTDDTLRSLLDARVTELALSLIHISEPT
ncbi:hypothetical protein, partial [uncultured Corynebacterium sp.]|uniref:hypothetical protein n=1 Tax=uncultured Corynebacterium sp. TaxID=159447 RepID=UPI0026237B60